MSDQPAGDVVPRPSFPATGMGAEQAADVVHRMAVLWPNQLERGAADEAEVASRLVAWKEFLLRYPYEDAMAGLDQLADHSRHLPARSELRDAILAVQRAAEQRGVVAEQQGILPGGGIRQTPAKLGAERTRDLKATLGTVARRLRVDEAPRAPVPDAAEAAKENLAPLRERMRCKGNPCRCHEGPVRTPGAAGG